jgi:two-component system chemotaxis response regulator CheV
MGLYPAWKKIVHGERDMRDQEILLETGTNELEIMTFEMGDQMFGMNVAKIQSILQYEPALLTHLPQAPPSMMGMLQYRHRTIPLIGLGKALHLKKQELGERPVVMVTEFNNSVNGFLVDAVDRIHRLYWHDFVPVDDLLSLHSESINGSVHIGEHEVLIIDMERVLADIFPDQILEEVTEETIKKAETLTRQNVRIFFAEDSRPIRETVVRSLRKIGFVNVTPFENGLKAYEALVEASEKAKKDATVGSEIPHILLTDIEMPQMDGLTLCKKTKGELGLKQVDVIMFSSLINDQMIVKCDEVGASGYITKPEINNLAAMLDEVCQKQAAAA